MPLPPHLAEPQPLSYIIKRLAELPVWSWLYILDETLEITSTTLCYPRTSDAREMSEEEYEEFEASLARHRLKGFLSPAQLEDIIDNLRQQRAAYSTSELFAAIDFYWRNDAFVTVSAG